MFRTITAMGLAATLVVASGAVAGTPPSAAPPPLQSPVSSTSGESLCILGAQIYSQVPAWRDAGVRLTDAITRVREHLAQALKLPLSRVMEDPDVVPTVRTLYTSVVSAVKTFQLIESSCLDAVAEQNLSTPTSEPQH